MHVLNIKRVDNDIYQVQLEGRNEKILVEVKSINSDQKDIIRKIFSELSETCDLNKLTNKKTLTIEKRKFIVRKSNKNNLINNYNFMQTTNFSQVVKLSISQVKDKSKKQPVTNQVLNCIVCEIHDAATFASVYKQGLFLDPYTSLAQDAMQTYHSDFAQKNIADETNPLIICLKYDFKSFCLVRQKDYNPTEYIPHSAQIFHYKDMLRKTWGEEKFAQIQHRYGINLDLMAQEDRPLTVDTIYKMNIGCGNIEIQDIKKIKAQLLLFKNYLEKLPPAMQFFHNPQFGDFPIAYVAALIKHIERDLTLSDLTAGEILGWFNTHPSVTDTAAAMTKENFSDFMSIFQLTDQERNLMYTGRELGDFIDSQYTKASVETFKPWLDDQELSECCAKLVNNTSWDHFMQQLSFVICKKHLVHTDMKLDFYTGSLIPAPRTADHPLEWYKVTSCINSGTGNFSYTLEPTAPDSTLPVIKLFRSTASDAYAMDSAASVKNDLNPINSPGYEGQELVVQYEKDFFLERTIPIWVACREQAQQLLNTLSADFSDVDAEKIDQAAWFLNQGMDEIKTERQEKRELMDIKALVGQYDWIVLNIFHSENLNKYKKIKLALLINRYANRPNEKIILKAQQIKDAKFLLSLLSQDSSLHALKFRENLQLFLDMQSNTLELKNKPLTQERILINRAKILQKTYLAAQDEESVKNLHDLVKTWSETLFLLSQYLNETVEQKKQQSIICAGHSLGGALAQRTFAKYTLLSHRVPVFNQTFTLYDFDAPAINAKDNKKFIQTGDKHHALLHEMGQPLHINRYQVSGDFIPLGGEQHLGGTLTHEETFSAGFWLNFNAQIIIPSENSTYAGITNATFKHSIQAIPPVYLGQNDIKTTNERLVPFDTGVQGHFNKGQHNLHSKLWNIDPVMNNTLNAIRAAPVLRTTARSLVDSPSKAKARASDPKHGAWRDYTDEQGVFVVGENGVISNRARNP